MRRPSSRPGGQRPRSRRRGRLDPLNGSVTRADIEAIYADCTREVDPPPTAKEFLKYLLGAIQDPSPGPRTRAKMRRKAVAREAAKRRARQARSELAQLPVRAAAAA